jgi:hypothetical protein
MTMLRWLRRWWAGTEIDVLRFDQYEDMGQYAYASGLVGEGRFKVTSGTHILLDVNGEFQLHVITGVDAETHALRWMSVDEMHWIKRQRLAVVDGE